MAPEQVPADSTQEAPLVDSDDVEEPAKKAEGGEARRQEVLATAVARTCTAVGTLGVVVLICA